MTGKDLLPEKDLKEKIYNKNIYNKKYSFNEYRNIGKYMDDSPESRYNKLVKFYNRLNEFKKFTPQAVIAKEKKKTVYNNAKNLFNKLLNIYYIDYVNIPYKGKEKMSEKYNPSNSLIKGHIFIELKKEDKEKIKSQPEESISERVKLRRQKADHDISSLEVDDSDEFINIPDMPPLEDDKEKVKERK